MESFILPCEKLENCFNKSMQTLEIRNDRPCQFRLNKEVIMAEYERVIINVRPKVCSSRHTGVR